MGSPRQHSNRHEVIIDASDQKKIFDQIVLWGEASWWPLNCLMQFSKIGDLPIQKGTMYKQQVKVPFGPQWLSLVTDIVDKVSISRKYLDGFIDGEETLRLIPFYEKTKVQYELTYTIKGSFYWCAWKVCLKMLHDRNIVSILRQLKYYIER